MLEEIQQLLDQILCMMQMRDLMNLNEFMEKLKSRIKF